jgi:hypothetical protein
MTCRYSPRHHGPHHDPKRKGHYWTETFYRGEFMEGRSKVPTVRKERTCKTCGKPRRTDGAPDACVCRETEANRRQAIMFADERERAVRQEQADEMQVDIDWIRAHHARLIEERCESYQGEF